MRTWLVLVVFAGACWTQRVPARPAEPSPLAPAATAGGSTGSGIRFASRPTNRCARVIDHLFEQSRAEISSTGMSEAFIQELQETVVASCEETEWSSESLDCYEETASSSEMTACFSAMPSEQQEDIKRRMNELVQRQTASPPPPP